jgi:hypothetical protein
MGAEVRTKNKKTIPTMPGWPSKPKPTAYETKNLIFLLLYY